MDIGQKLQQARELAGMTQQDVADKMDVSRQAINDMEARANLETDNIARYLTAIGSTFAKLFESHIPDKFHNSKHWQLHEMLQEIFDAEEQIGDKWSWGITANIEGLHRASVEDLRKFKRANPGQRRAREPLKVKKSEGA